MSHGFSRREILTTGLAAVGWLFTDGLRRGRAGEPSVRRAEIPDRSGQAPCPPVAIQKCASYEGKELRQRLDRALELIGGIKDLVGGKTVTMKINVTGGPGSLCGLPGYRTYQVHPNLVAAMCAALHDAGARRIVLVESQYSLKSPEEVLHDGGWDVRAIRSAGGQKVTFEDTRNRGRWPGYSKLTVPWGGFIFPAFHLNPRYEKTDVFVSLAKLKDHGSAGVTMAVKNLFGITPTSLYGSGAPDENVLSNRMEILHSGKRTVPAGVPPENDHRLPADWRCRVPRITADLLGARPVDLAVIDGIESNRGGDGPWMKLVEPIKPGLLLAGRNAVTTDAIAAAAMGYNPQAAHREFPFPGDNHLLLLSQVGVGAIDPQRIEVRGVPLAKALCPYNPKRIPLELPAAWYNHCPHDPVARA